MPAKTRLAAMEEKVLTQPEEAVISPSKCQPGSQSDSGDFAIEGRPNMFQGEKSTQTGDRMSEEHGKKSATDSESVRGERHNIQRYTKEPDRIMHFRDIGDREALGGPPQPALTKDEVQRRIYTLSFHRSVSIRLRHSYSFISLPGTF